MEAKYQRLLKLLSNPPAWLFLGLVFTFALILQSRAPAPALYAAPTDAAKYLSLARGAPSLVLYDEHAYMIHPPLYPWLVRSVSTLTRTPLTTAAPLLSGFAWAALALMTAVLSLRLYPEDRAVALIAAGLLAMSCAGSVLGAGVWREPILAATVLALALVITRERGKQGVWAGIIAAGLLGAALGALWDAFILIAPVLLGLAWWRRDPRPAAAGLALLATWGIWAAWRATTLLDAGAWPAGIDGLPEITNQLNLGTLFNPNLLAETAQRNNFFAPLKFTPHYPIALLAPWPGSTMEMAPDAPASPLVIVLMTGWILAGLWLTIRAASRKTSSVLTNLLTVLLICAPAALPAVIGGQARYGVVLLPVIAVLGARSFGALPRPPVPAFTGVFLIALTLVAGGLWLANRPAWTWSRPIVIDGRGIAQALGPGTAAIAAPVGLTPDLAWQLPGRRIVTLPLNDQDVLHHIKARQAAVIVLPHEVRVFSLRSQNNAELDHAYGLGSRRRIQQALAAGDLTWLGIAVEADVTDRVRVRAFDLIGTGFGEAPPAFGMRLETGILPILEQALSAGAASPELWRQFERHQPLIVATGHRDGDPESAAMVIELVRHWSASQDSNSP